MQRHTHFPRPMSTQPENKPRSTFSLYQPSEYISYYRVPIVFSLASYLQTGKPRGVLSPWQVGQLSRRQVMSLPKSHWKLPGLNERIVTKQAWCHQPWLLNLQQTTWSHKAITLGTQRAASQKCYLQMWQQSWAQREKFLTRSKHHLLKRANGRAVKYHQKPAKVTDEQLSSTAEDTEHVPSPSQRAF